MTDRCRQLQPRLYPYLDGELEAGEEEAVEVHLAACSACREVVARERAFRRRVLGALPREAAPAELRAEVEQLVELRLQQRAARRAQMEVTGAAAVAGAGAAGGRAGGPWQAQRRLALRVAAVALVVGLAGAAGWFAAQPVQATSLAVAAVAQHDRFVRGLLEPEVAGPSQARIDAWLRRRLDFPVRFPELPAQRPAEPLSLLGARLTYLGGTQAAFLMYTYQGEKISLFALPREAAAIRTDTRLSVGRTTFYYRPQAGYDVMMWTHGDVSYILISTLTEAVGRACVVCHSPAETDGFYFRLQPLFGGGPGEEGASAGPAPSAPGAPHGKHPTEDHSAELRSVGTPGNQTATPGDSVEAPPGVDSPAWGPGRERVPGGAGATGATTPERVADRSPADEGGVMR